MPNANEFVIERAYDAPVSLVYKMWTEREQLNQWWGPPGWENEVVSLDLRPGGVFLYSMKAPDGSFMYGKFVYREIVKNEKLIFVDSFCDKDGNVLRHPMANKWPLEILNTLIFTEANGRTLLTLKNIAINASVEEVKTFVEGFSSLNQGWSGTLKQLEDSLKAAGN